MSSSYPITKSVRWRMKDWMSCFIACRLPAIVDGEKEKEGSISPPLQPTTSVQKHRKGGRRRRKYKHRRSSSSDDITCNEGIKEEDVIKVSSIEGQSKNSSTRSLVPEEEYIEFCFQDNGQIHKMEEIKQIQPKFVKLKVKEEESSHLVEESNNESKQEEGALLVSRSSSNLSDGSTTSFSFPVLVDSRRSWEGVDTPVFMPPLPENDAIAPSSNSKDNDSHLHSCKS